MAPPAHAAVQPIIYFGGSFDPPHKGHVALAEAALAQLPQAELLLVPTGSPSSYKSRSLSSAEHRLALCQLAFGALPRCHISRVEVFSQQANYTINTLTQLDAERQAQHLPPAQWHLLLGADQMAHLHQWHRWQELVTRVHILLAERELTDPAETAQAQHNAAQCPHVQALQRHIPTVSSTQIRQHIQAHRPSQEALPWLPAAVLRYIDDHSLYQDPSHGY